MLTTVDHPLPGDAERRCPAELWELGEKAAARARRWADESASQPVPRTARLLARILSDPDGLGFTTRFVDDVVRPIDLDVASHALARLAAGRTDFLPRSLAAAMGLGGRATRLAPRSVTTVARRVFREIVGDLVVDATDRGLGPALARLRPGVDGVILSDAGHRATFLPQVWEQLPDPADFLAHLRRKAGLPAGHWERDLTIETYTVTAWQETEAGIPSGEARGDPS